MMRRVGPKEDKGPMFFLVFQASPSVWNSRAYWSVGSANDRAEALRAQGKLAFVEAR